MADKVKITFVVPEKLQQDMRQQIITDGYSMRGKSHWVSEAITSLLAMPNFSDFVQFGDEMHGFEKAETIVVSPELKRTLDNAMITIRRDHPILEGVQSRIIRTSILQRLIRS
jgi:hypothetical protein